MFRKILFDFDGVILDSSTVKEDAFRKVLRDFPREAVESLVEYHRGNGGLSRYHKFGYFLDSICGQKPDPDLVARWSREFSEAAKEQLADPARLIADTLAFIRKERREMHIVSGADGDEVRWLCDRLDLSRHFRTVQGSPTPKVELVARLLAGEGWKKEETVLIGDSVNDLRCAADNGIAFYGYNNPALRAHTDRYIESFAGFELL